MQSETPTFPQTLNSTTLRSTPLSSHHGRSPQLVSPSPPWSEEPRGVQRSSSDWSLSTSSSPSDYDTWLGPGNALASRSPSLDGQVSFFSLANNARDSPGRHNLLKASANQSYILDCPHEILLQVLSHLPATDLLTVKLVSRRFYSLVNSPHAWISAFSKYFPGPASIKTISGKSALADDDERLMTEKRAFTRLSAVPSWTGEYLLRTKLLRCLERGRPSLPFVAPAQGKPHKGFATFSFSSRLAIISNLDARFGAVQEKRLPQFIHGSDLTGAVSISDRRGELAGWGLTQSAATFRSFSQHHPGSAAWGLGYSDIVGCPNVMDVSTNHGMVYGEGLPGGYAYYLPANDKRGKFLAPFLGISDYEQRVPRIAHDLHSICSVWVAKTASVPRTTNGMVGILTGSSSGVVSAYSTGTPGGRDQRLDKGELTARWLLSPGVPIIKVVADDQFTTERNQLRRIWAFAVNALGEIFSISMVPSRSPIIDGPADQFDANHEIRAWQTGHNGNWRLVHATQRTHKPFSNEEREHPTYLPSTIFELVDENRMQLSAEMRVLQKWESKDPIDVKASFEGWDMQRKVEVDFSGDDGNGGGQSVVVIECANDDHETRTATVKRHLSCGLRQDLTSSLATITPTTADRATDIEWRSSELLFGHSKNYQVTATALDKSQFALTTAFEDVALKYARTNEELLAKQTAESLDVDKHSPFKIPGQRGRFVAVGTDTGQIFIWNLRAPAPSSAKFESKLDPVRVIQTDSSAISSLAMSALYLVHGGCEGLVQAWDPMGSTLGPVRTICSALTRRALMAAQPEPNGTSQALSAVGAICLDPDPTVLRGIVALRGKFRMWGYSSSSATKASPKSQKRKLHRAARGLNSSPGDAYVTGRRTGLKGLVDQELVTRGIDAEQQRIESKERARVAGRFGLDLLGEDVDEETMLAYAKLLSEEEEEQKFRKSAEKKLPEDATESEIEEHMSTLTDEELEKFKFASWPQRFEMSTSGSSTVPHGSPPSSEHDDLAKALELSLYGRDANLPSSPAQGPSSMPSASNEGVAEGIWRSLKTSPSSPASPPLWASPKLPEEDELERAIRLSLEDADGASTSSRERRDGRINTGDEDDFPALGSSPSPPSSGAGGAWGSAKGKRRAW